MFKAWNLLIAAAVWSACSPALAQEAPATAQGASASTPDDSAIAEKMLGAGGRVTPDRSRSECLRTMKEGEITVCAPAPDQFRIPSTADDDPTGSAGTRDGRLHTPDVAGNGIFKGKATVGGKCFVPPCPPAPVYMIDLASIPIAPAGSDADKIAKGELRTR